VSTYLVTGCAGFIGSHLSDSLLARGDSVVGVDSFTGYYARSVKERNLVGAADHPRFTLVEADLATAEIDPLLDGVAGIFHLAAQPGVRGSWGTTFEVYTRDNISVTQRVFEAAAPRSLRVVFASSSSVYGDAEAYPTPEDARPAPVSPYGVTKLCCEHLARAYGRHARLDAVALRYFTVYGPRQRPDMAFTRLFRALAEGTIFEIYGDGGQSRDVTYVADAVNATLLAMERGRAGVAYNVGGGAETSLSDVIALAESLSGRDLATRFAQPAAGDVRRTAADTTQIRRDCGWAPQTPLADGLSAQLESALRAPWVET
jgi:UDP-glucuronate 4-epimerase